MSSIFTMAKILNYFSLSPPAMCVRMPHQWRAQLSRIYHTDLFSVLITMIRVIVRAQFYPFSWGQRISSTFQHRTYGRLANVISPTLDFSTTLHVVPAQTLSRTHAQTNPTQRLFVSSHFSLSCTRSTSSMLYTESLHSKKNPILRVLLLLFLFFACSQHFISFCAII